VDRNKNELQYFTYILENIKEKIIMRVREKYFKNVHILGLRNYFWASILGK